MGISGVQCANCVSPDGDDIDAQNVYRRHYESLRNYSISEAFPSNFSNFTNSLITDLSSGEVFHLAVIRNGFENEAISHYIIACQRVGSPLSPHSHKILMIQQGKPYYLMNWIL